MKKKKEDNIYDFKSWKVPVRWDEINLKTWSKIQQLYMENEDSSLVELISILCNKNRSEVQELPTSFLDIILTHLQFLYTPIPKIEPKPYIEINNERYEINIMEKLKTGEYIDVSTILKDDKFNYAAMLAILCRKKGETYNDDFIAEKLDGRIKMFEKLPITEVLPIIAFFLNCYLLSETTSQLSTTVEQGIRDMRKNIQNLRTNGEVSAHSYKSVMKTLKKLENAVKNI